MKIPVIRTQVTVHSDNILNAAFVILAIAVMTGGGVLMDRAARTHAGQCFFETETVARDAKSRLSAICFAIIIWSLALLSFIRLGFEIHHYIRNYTPSDRPRPSLDHWTYIAVSLFMTQLIANVFTSLITFESYRCYADHGAGKYFVVMWTETVIGIIIVSLPLILMAASEACEFWSHPYLPQPLRFFSRETIVVEFEVI